MTRGVVVGGSVGNIKADAVRLVRKMQNFMEVK
jgi:hypothetical protein